MRTTAGTLVAAVEALRPRQWLKNLLLFAGILFAVKLGDAGRWAEAATAFVAYCAASSAAYLVNDVRDAAADRAHPVKRHRPIAAGRLSPATAVGMSGALAAAALALAIVLGARSALLLAGFLVLQAAYSFGLKLVALADVLAIGGLFAIRAGAGAAAVHVSTSPWLLVCAFLLAVFLGLAKRRGEITRTLASGEPARAVLQDYSVALLDQLLSVVAASAVVAYAIYTFSAQSDAMMLTIPFVLFGIFRYLLLIHKLNLGEEPERVLLSDRVTLLNVAGWSLAVALILSVS